MSLIHSDSSQCPYLTIASSAMEKVFSRTPRSYQGLVVSHLLKTMAFELPPEPVLMVQPTGSGKSTIPLTCAVVPGGVTFVIENTLALASDQASKVASLVNPGIKVVKSYQLDKFKTNNELQRLCDGILAHLSKNPSTSFVCYSSPKTLVNATTVSFVDQLVKERRLNLFCIDEIHLFIEFGISFRQVFQSLKNKNIKLFCNNDGSMKVPILLMTATFDTNMFHLIQRMLGVKIYSNNIFWVEAHEFQKRHIAIHMKYSTLIFKYTTDYLSSHCNDRDDNKAIIISSTASRAKDIQEKIDSWLDSNDSIKGDSVLVVGDLETETKFAYTTKFTNSYFGVGGESFLSDNLYPRFLLGTPGCIGAGLDCSTVDLVCRVGLPSSIIHFIQEMCRCGRSSNSSNNTFSIIFHLNDYVYLVERLYVIDNENSNNVNHNPDAELMTKKEERQYYIDNLNRMCCMLFCDCGCWHICLELVSANPFTTMHQSHRIPTCGQNCPHCDKTRLQYIKPINKAGMQTFLATTLLCNHDKNFTPASLVKALLDYPMVGRLIYGRKSALKAEKSSNAAISVLQMLSCDIIQLHIKESHKPQSICILSRSGSQPHYLIDEFWDKIFHF